MGYPGVTKIKMKENEMTRKKLLMLLGSLALVVMLVVPFVAACAGPTPTPTPTPTSTPTPAPEYKWRFGVPYTNELENTTHRLFSSLVKSYSDGRMEVEVYPDGLLGSHTEIFHGVQEGSIEIAVLSPHVDLVPGGMLQSMPWAVGTYDETGAAFLAPDGILYRLMSDAWEEVGFEYLFSVVMGKYGFANNVRPLKSPADFKNLKMRVSGSLACVQAYQNMSEGTGMTFETIPWEDLYNALERGVIDAMWTGWVELIDMRHYEVAKYFTPLDAWVFSLNAVVNQAKWDELPPDLQDVLFRAGRIAEMHAFESHRRVDMEYQNILIDLGLEIYYITDEEREVFREKANTAEIWEELAKPYLDEHYPGQNMYETMQDELTRISAEY